ncbi:MAG TPA: beta-galactosidase [Opitutaceae bacterium]|nr:beta-galactosidase [Opitutaceae bacterium]
MRRLLPLLLLASLVVRADPAPRNFSHPDRIRYDGRCLTIDGQDTLIFSGTFHYFRCPKPLWRERFRKIKEAGCNAVETYVPWNWHERNMPASLDDFSQVDLTDLKEWIHMAQDEFGLYTIIRPGPYICAEWDGGGFPRWLLTKMPAAAKVSSDLATDPQAAAGADAAPSKNPEPKRPAWLRSDDPVFLAWSEHWFKAVCPVIAAAQVTKRPPHTGGVILFQIENEYDLFHPPSLTESARIAHLKALYRAAVDGGIEVPIFTCWTKQVRGSTDPDLSQVFDAFNSYPRWGIDGTAKRIRDLQAAQPDAPVMISELQGGWFSGVGGKLSEDQPGLSAEQINAHTLLAIQTGATLLNYYVIFGGTNFGYWPGRGNTATYDYFAPIREWGAVGQKYLAVKAIGQMLQEHGAELARSHEIPCQAETGSPDVTVGARAARNGDLFIFFRNHSITEARKGEATVWPGAAAATVVMTGRADLHVAYDLGPFGMKILHLKANDTSGAHGEWLPRPVEGPRRPATVPAAVRPATAQLILGGDATDWKVVQAGERLPELGVDDARPVLYASTVSLDQAPSDGATLVVRGYPGDKMVFRVNGRVYAVEPPPKPGSGWTADVGEALHSGHNAVDVLYQQEGQSNFGPTIQDESGLREGELDIGGTVVPIEKWSVARQIDLPGPEAGSATVALDTVHPVARKGGLETVPSGPVRSLESWYKVEFELPAQVPGVWVPWRALVSAAGDGEILLNGQSLGRYWEAGPQREYFLPECWLHFGSGQKNILTFRLNPATKGVALRAVEISPYPDSAEVR